MLATVTRWAMRPPQWDAVQALADPLAWCSLSPWVSVDSLRRGFQVGPAEVQRAWCIGWFQYPHQVAWVYGSDRLRRAASPWLFILPAALGELCKAAGEPTTRGLCLRLARADLFIPASASVMPKTINLPGDGGRQCVVYAFRGEIGLLPPDGAPAVAQALAALARANLAGWYGMHAPAQLVPRPWFGTPDAERPKRQPFDARARRTLAKAEQIAHPERERRRREAARASKAQGKLF